ncbi:MAG: cytochrome c [Edaphobacter sp.]
MASKQVLGTALGIGGLLVALVAAVQAQTTPAQQPSAHTTSKPQSGAQQAGQSSNDGERIFAQNCSRCHNAPEGFSPRISGTVVRHMRVRAQLSQRDAEELLRFFNP